MRRTVSALALCALAGPALAEVDAAAVWEDLRAGAEAWGYAVDAGSVDIGETEVSVRDLVFTYADARPAGDADADAGPTEITLRLPTLRITEDGDAAVIELPASMPFEASGPSGTEGAAPTRFGGTVDQEAMRITVSEAADGKLYAYAADAVALTLDRFEGPDAPDAFDVALRLEDVTGDSRVTRSADGHRVSAQTTDVARLTISADVSDTGEEPGDFALAVAVADVSGTGTAVLPEDADMADMAGALAAGLDIASNLALGASRTEMEFSAPDGSFSYAANSNGGTFDVALGPDAIRYGGTSKGSRVSIVGSTIPVPELSYALDSARFLFTMPPLASPEPQDFGLDLALRGLEINDSIWALFDPQAVLPRDPANIVLEMSGAAVFPEGIMEMSSGPADSSRQPELVSLDVRTIELSLAGAAILGSAMFTGTPGGAPVAPGLPPIEGKAELSATGVNALMDGLAQLGLVPPQQAAMVRGMLGFIARPTGEDSYATELELGPNGLTANGVPLR